MQGTRHIAPCLEGISWIIPQDGNYLIRAFLFVNVQLLDGGLDHFPSRIIVLMPWSFGSWAVNRRAGRVIALWCDSAEGRHLWQWKDDLDESI